MRKSEPDPNALYFFRSCTFKFKCYISWDDLKGIPKSTESYLRTIANVADGGIYLSRTPNNINLSYYVNHSNKPNVFHNLDTDEFYAICDIDEDEEILCTYT
ncbi:MAG: SET domain-containing protein, partial [Burkholderiaceae bacterium]|nr:SET domain-containing protein [Burkholderiaceae bacterium]